MKTPLSGAPFQSVHNTTRGINHETPISIRRLHGPGLAGHGRCRPRRPVGRHQARGELVCGTLGTSQPFSFRTAPRASWWATTWTSASWWRTSWGVKVSYKLLSVARVPELNEGRVDILAANLGYSPDRAQQIAFSHAYYVSPQKLLVRKDSGLDTIESLNGRRVGATKGFSSGARSSASWTSRRSSATATARPPIWPCSRRRWTRSSLPSWCWCAWCCKARPPRPSA